MKKSAKLKRKTRRLILKNLIVFAVLIAVLSVGVRSWFKLESSNEASGIHVTCAIPEGLEVAILAPGETPDDSTVWYNTSFTVDPETYTFLNLLSLAEVTGDGKTFIKPPITQYSSVAYPNTSTDADWSANVIKTTPNVEYLSLDVYFRTRNSGCKVILDQNTMCSPVGTVTSWGSAVAGWNPDSVIGAARVSVVESNTTRRLLWIPAPFLYFDPIRQSGDGQLETDVTDTGKGAAGGNRGLYYFDGDNYVALHNDGTYNHGYWESKSSRQLIEYGNDPAADVTANTEMDYKLHKDVDIFTFPNTTTTYTVDDEQEQFYSGFSRVNIWIEGEDPECRAKQLTGQIKAILSFKISSASEGT